MFAISGHAENKKLEELLPGILNQLGPDNLMNLKKVAESFASQNKAAGSSDNDDIPDVGENFEDVSKS